MQLTEEEKKARAKAKRRALYQANKEKRKEAARLYYHANRKKVLEKQKQLRLADPSPSSWQTKKWRHKHPDRARENSRRNYLRNAEKRRAASLVRYHKLSPELRRARAKANYEANKLLLRQSARLKHRWKAEYKKALERCKTPERREALSIIMLAERKEMIRARRLMIEELKRTHGQRSGKAEGIPSSVLSKEQGETRPTEEAVGGATPGENARIQSGVQQAQSGEDKTVARRIPSEASREASSASQGMAGLEQGAVGSRESRAPGSEPGSVPCIQPGLESQTEKAQ